MMSSIDSLGHTSEPQTTSNSTHTVLVRPRGSERKTHESAIPVEHLGQVATEGFIRFQFRPTDSPGFLRILRKDWSNEPVVANISLTYRMLELLGSEILAKTLGADIVLDFTSFTPESVSRRERDLNYESLQRQSLAEERAFQRLKPELLENDEFSGKFVAIIEGHVVDSDTDEERLAVRLLKKYGHRPLYIGFAGDRPPMLFIPPIK